jgi:hypothetical protein
MGQGLAAVCVLISCCTAGNPLAIAQSDVKCPLNLSHLDLRYRHSGGNSQPQLNLAFTNISERKLTRIVFALSILDSGGYSRSHDDDLIYSKGAYPGKPVFFRWTLIPESVDIHHTGESVEVKEVAFADGSTWRGDGSPACTATVDFHPK